MYRPLNKETGKVVAEFQEYENLKKYRKIRSDVEFTFEDTETKHGKKKKIQYARPKKNVRAKNTDKVNMQKTGNQSQQFMDLQVPFSEGVRNWEEIASSFERIRAEAESGNKNNT